MIIKASQRSGAAELAVHLPNEHDNDHIEIHEINGFITDALPEALKEIQALSAGTRCTQYLFSVSLSPPKDEFVSVSVFEDTINRIEEKTGLKDQPRVIVFHEKNNRRHAHCVWSRIDSENMKAVNLPYFKNRLMEISKELYLEQGWTLPQGFIDREMRNPLNFTREQWQQAKRLEENPQLIKQNLKECWAISDNKNAFSQALEQHGFYLAKGDRRGFVAVDWRGEVYSLSRWLDVKTKALKKRLGHPVDLPSVKNIKDGLDQKLTQRIHDLTTEIKQVYEQRFSPVLTQKKQMAQRHDQERRALTEKQEKQRDAEMQERQNRFNKGFSGLWDRLTGKHSKIVKQNETEAYQTFLQDRTEKDTLIYGQIEQRQMLQTQLNNMQTQQQEELATLKQALFLNIPDQKISQIKREFNHVPSQPLQTPDQEMEI